MTLMTDNTIEDDVDNSQNTPLHVAAEQGHFMCLEVHILTTAYFIYCTKTYFYLI